MYHKVWGDYIIHSQTSTMQPGMWLLIHAEIKVKQAS